MFSFLIASFFALLSCITFVACQGTAPTIDVGYAKIVGFQNTTSGLNQYHGIYYAQAPIGELRWRKARPIEPTMTDPNMVINATQIGPSCWNGVPYWRAHGAITIPPGTTNSSEDCLLLDVFTPMNPVASSLPVLVEIHGGGYTQGSAQSPRPDSLMYRANGTFVWVSLQYRLGMFGFMAGRDIYDNGDLNVGLLDQRLALEWVQRHVAAFGGDPARVTITGSSAGGGSVSLQMMANGGTDFPPFRAVFAEYPWWQPFQNISSSERQYRDVLALANCPDINCLRGLSEDQLHTIQQLVMNNTFGQPPYADGDFYFGPVVDGRFLRELPNEAYKNGNFYKVAFMVDHNEWEGYAYSQLINETSEVIPDADTFFPGRGRTFFSKLFELYPAQDYNATFWQRVDWFSDVVVDCPTYFMSKAQTDRGYNGSAVFKMRFNAGTQVHGATGGFLYDINLNRPAANNQTLADIMQWYLISFVIYNDPNPLKLAEAPFWPSYSAGAQDPFVGFSTLAVTYTTIEVEADQQNGAKCDFLDAEGYLSFGMY